MGMSIGVGVGSIGGVPIADPVQVQRVQFVDMLMNTPPIGANVVSQFIVLANATTKGVDVSFAITDITGMASLSLVRAVVQDVKQGFILQSWTASVSNFAWSDTDAILQQSGQAFYWLKLEPVNATGSELVVGPQFILLNPSLLAPLPLSGISASHGPEINGTVLVTVNVSGIVSGDSCKIYVTGYNGNPSPVAVAQSATPPVQFTLQQTGETVTLTAIAVSSGGAEAASGPTCTLTLNATATAIAKVQNVSVAQLATGNQVMWPSSREQGITSYQLWRGDRGTTFGGASLLATIAATSSGTVIYLDTGGLGGDYQYFVIAVSAFGNSPPSDPANPIVLFSSSQLPANVPVNNSSSGFLDSVDAGSNATIRVYGGGGPGTSWTRQTGYGSATRPAGSILGLAYATLYYVLYHAGSYLATTSYTNTLPDDYEWVGVIYTCSVGGAVGVGATAAGSVNGLGEISNCTPVAEGSGYIAATVTFTGGGIGASADGIISAGKVIGYKNIVPGSGYATGNCTVNGITSTAISIGTRFVSSGA